MKFISESFAQPGAAEIQHDLRALLTRIRLATELLHSKDQALLAAIRQDIDTCQLMLRQPFAPTDNLTEQRVVTDLNDLIQEEIRVMEQCLRITIEQNLLSEPLEILVQPLAIKRVLTNLLINACHYGGGWISISSGKTADDIWFQVANNGPEIIYGEPMRPLQPGVRDPSVVTSPAKGSGLGLAIVKKIITRHRGGLQLQPRSPQGLCVTITLPIKILTRTQQLQELY